MSTLNSCSVLKEVVLFFQPSKLSLFYLQGVGLACAGQQQTAHQLRACTAAAEDTSPAPNTMSGTYTCNSSSKDKASISTALTHKYTLRYIKFYKWLCYYGYFACMHIWIICMPDTHGVQKRMLGTLEQELQVIISSMWVLGIKFPGLLEELPGP